MELASRGFRKWSEMRGMMRGMFQRVQWPARVLFWERSQASRRRNIASGSDFERKEARRERLIETWRLWIGEVLAFG